MPQPNARNSLEKLCDWIESYPVASCNYWELYWEIKVTGPPMPDNKKWCAPIADI